MTEIKIPSWDREEILRLLVGRRVVSANTKNATLELDNGVKIVFEREADDCCSWVELSKLATCDNVITKAEFGDNEDETGGEGPYHAYLYVVTEAGEFNVAEAEGNASNGYYLHGFALGATVIVPDDYDA